MTSEQLAIFDETFKRIGSASRDDVHRQGLWHETFHCWIIGYDDSGAYVDLQLRSPDKLIFQTAMTLQRPAHPCP